MIPTIPIVISDGPSEKMPSLGALKARPAQPKARPAKNFVVFPSSLYSGLRSRALSKHGLFNDGKIAFKVKKFIVSVCEFADVLLLKRPSIFIVLVSCGCSLQNAASAFLCLRCLLCLHHDCKPNTPLKATCMRGAWPQSSQVGTVTDRIRCLTDSFNDPLTKSRRIRKDEGKPGQKTAGTLGWVGTRNTQPMPLTSWRAASCASLRQVPTGEYQFSTHKIETRPQK